MNKIQTSKMVRETATNTQKRKEKIMNGVRVFLIFKYLNKINFLL